MVSKNWLGRWVYADSFECIKNASNYHQCTIQSLSVYVLPFGPSSSPAIIQQVTNNPTEDIEITEAYQDNVVEHTSDKTDHDAYFWSCLEFYVWNVVVNEKKCFFSVSGFECLNYPVNGNGFRSDSKQAASSGKVPLSKKFSEPWGLLSALQF